MSVVSFQPASVGGGGALKRHKPWRPDDDDDDKKYVVIPRAPKPSPFQRIATLVETLDPGERATLTLTRDVNGTLFGADRVKISVSKATVETPELVVQGEILESTVAGYTAHAHATVSVSTSGASALRLQNGDGQQQLFTRFKFKARKERKETSTTQFDTYLSHSEEITAIRIP
jgi:hypothetical protein